MTPFQAETLGELFENIFTKSIIPPRERNPAIPADFDALVMRCLVEGPGWTPCDGEGARCRPRPFVDPRRSMTSIPAGTLPAATPHEFSQGSSTTLGRAAAVSERSDSLRPQKRGSWGWVAMACVAAVVGAGGFSFVRSQSHPAGATAAPSAIGLSNAVPASVPAVASSAPVVLAASAVPSTPLSASAAPVTAPSAASSRALAGKAKAPQPTPKSPLVVTATPAAPAKPAHTSSDPFASPD